jgi:hypothetical protein
MSDQPKSTKHLDLNKRSMVYCAATPGRGLAAGAVLGILGTSQAGEYDTEADIDDAIRAISSEIDEWEHRWNNRPVPYEDYKRKTDLLYKRASLILQTQIRSLLLIEYDDRTKQA